MTSVVLALVLSAQALVAQPPVSIATVTGGLTAHLMPIEADLSVPGKEILVYLPGSWIVTIGRWHPTKHGLVGLWAGPGLCVEHWTWIVPMGEVWHFLSVVDGNADGVDEVIVYLDDGTVVPYTSTGLQACR